MSKRPVVLVVEDHEDSRDMLRIALESEGYEVETAADGVRLIPKIRECKPQLILLDVLVPWVRGVDLCKTIKESPDLKDIPVFFVTALNSPEDQERGFSAGACEYIGKPIDLNDLFTRIRRYIPDAA